MRNEKESRFREGAEGPGRLRPPYSAILWIMKIAIARIVSVALIASLFGCSIVAPWKQDILLETEPPGATVRIDGVDVGKTPLLVPIRKSGSTPVGSRNGPKVVF